MPHHTFTNAVRNAIDGAVYRQFPVNLKTDKTINQNPLVRIRHYLNRILEAIRRLVKLDNDVDPSEACTGIAVSGAELLPFAEAILKLGEIDQSASIKLFASSADHIEPRILAQNRAMEHSDAIAPNLTVDFRIPDAIVTFRLDDHEPQGVLFTVTQTEGEQVEKLEASLSQLKRAMLSVYLAEMRKADPGKVIDLGPFDLSHTDLSGMDLHDCRFAGARVQASNFSRCNLRKVCFSGAIADGAQFNDQADLTEADFSGASLTSTQFLHARMSCTSFVGAQMMGAKLSYASATRADFSNADLTKVNGEGFEARSAIFAGADLAGLNLRDANLQNADFSAARFDNVHLPGVALCGYELSAQQETRVTRGLLWRNLDPIERQRLLRQHLEDQRRTHPRAMIKLAGFDLRNVNFAGLDLRYCDFSGALLHGADFTDCDLYRLKFVNAQANAASFSRALLTGCEFSGASLKGADFASAKATSVKWDRADLTGANYLSADLSSSDFSGTVRSMTRFNDCRLHGITINGKKITADSFDADDQTPQAVIDTIRRALASAQAKMDAESAP